MADKVVVMISSTIYDLPQHRGEVEKACLQQEMFPDMMEHLPASGMDAARVSLDVEKLRRSVVRNPRASSYSRSRRSAKPPTCGFHSRKILLLCWSPQS